MRYLSNKEKRNLEKYLKEKYNIDIKDIDRISYDEKIKVYFYDKYPIAFERDEIYPTIYLISKYQPDMKYVKVNIGAKDKILNGADIFRPGIIEISEDIKKGDIVLIISEDKKLLGIGKALYDYEEIIKMEKGKVIENIHYYGDKISKLLDK